jgi:protoporphyrinogen oxidase
MGRAAVIGGGVLGLAVARELRRRGEDVTVFEASIELGGLAAPWRIGDVVWDRHYHVTLESDARTRELLDWVGLDQEIEWCSTKTGFYAGSTYGLRSATTPWELFRLPSLSPLDTVRIGATVVRGSRMTDGSALEDIPVADWLRRHSGGRAFDRFWVPLLRAKLGSAWTETSAAFIWATMRRLTQARRAGLSEERFGYVPGGAARIFEALAYKLMDNGVKILAGTPVIAVQTVGDQQVVVTEHGSERFDRVVVTTAAPLAAKLCLDLTTAERERLRRVRYQGVICASVLLPEKLSDYYLTYITDPSTPFTAVVEMTSIVDPSELDGRHLLYLPKYVSPEDPMFDMSNDELQTEFFGYLKRMAPHFDPDSVEAFRVSRVRQVYAIPTLGYSRSMPPTTTSIPSLQIIGSANLPFSTLNIDDTLSLVDQVS